MKIIKLPCEQKVKCDVCGCEYEFDNNDICVSSETVRNLDGEVMFFPTLYTVCPFCRTKHELEINQEKKRGQK